MGRIDTLSSNNDGKGVLGLKISKNMVIKTWNNSFSDTSDGTLIPTDSPLFATVSAMKIGDLVTFSGEFLPSPSDCLRETSLSMPGGMADPEFLFRFTDVRRAQ